MLFYRLDREIVNLPCMTGAFNEPSKLAERDSSPGTAVSDHRCERVGVRSLRPPAFLRVFSCSRATLQLGTVVDLQCPLAPLRKLLYDLVPG